MNNQIILEISNDKMIIINLPCKIQELQRYSIINISLYLTSLSNNIILYEDDFAIEGIRTLKNILVKAIGNELELHDSLKERGIGYLCNEYFQDKPNLVMYEKEGNTLWVGLKFSLWCSKKYKTWIYNRNNHIILEITPIYNLEADDAAGEKYEEFLLNYCPTAVEVLEKEIVLQWMKKCDELLEIIYKNV